MNNKRANYVHYLSGEGIEIGALNNPLSLPPSLKVKYVDILSEGEINAHFLGAKIADIISDGTYFPLCPASNNIIFVQHFAVPDANRGYFFII